MIILPFCSFGYEVQGMYDTDRRIAIAYEYGRDVNANSLGKNHQKQHHMKILYSLCVVCTQDILFDSV